MTQNRGGATFWVGKQAGAGGKFEPFWGTRGAVGHYDYGALSMARTLGSVNPNQVTSRSKHYCCSRAVVSGPRGACAVPVLCLCCAVLWLWRLCVCVCVCVCNMLKPTVLRALTIMRCLNESSAKVAVTGRRVLVGWVRSQAGVYASAQSLARDLTLSPTHELLQQFVPELQVLRQGAPVILRQGSHITSTRA